MMSSQVTIAGSPMKSSSPNRRRAAFAKAQPMKPWLKDMGEPTLTKGAYSNANGSTFGSSCDGYVNLTESDLDVLADFEEE